MTNVDTIAQSKQGKVIRRERIACLKKTVDKCLLCTEIRQRKLEKRSSRKCPGDVMVWFSIAMWLYGNDCYTQVFRWLHRFSRGYMPSSNALTRARARIGVPIVASGQPELPPEGYQRLYVLS